ncbi:MAG: aminodeoxychorismate synthase component I [Actinobacteria bacterium]|nr:aminodeoxychorismate synthase component I [Actinomycetota bacterium]
MIYKYLVETENHLVVEFPVSREPADIFGNCLELESPIFLDSSLVDGRLGRYSVIGYSPFMIAYSHDGVTIVKTKTTSTRSIKNPFRVFGDLLKGFSCQRQIGDELPPYLGGGIGYISYDAGRLIERLPSIAMDDRRVPDFFFGFYDAFAVFDLVSNGAYLVAFVKPGEQREAARKRLEGLARTLSKKPVYRHRAIVARKNRLESTFTKAAYLKAVAKTKDYIKEGDIFQVNLSQRFTLPSYGNPYDLYYRLRQTNPAPFSAFLDFGEFSVASSSPERFIRATMNQVETRPIKGTRPRSASPDEDEALALELLSSEKDSAEHVMIVDVERNDFGRVCVPGSVKVTELMRLESYATVHHLVSTVVGRLSPGNGPAEVLEASFPGGSITGAPKIRAMERIEELEPVRRGIYTGSIVYCGFDGYMDSSIAIRTFVASRPRFSTEGPLDFHVGGGIVADSDPEAEYQETLDKAKGLMAALGVESACLS